MRDNQTDHKFKFTHADGIFLNKINGDSSSTFLSRKMSRRSGGTTLLILAAFYQTLKNNKKCVLFYETIRQRNYALELIDEKFLIREYTLNINKKLE